MTVLCGQYLEMELKSMAGVDTCCKHDFTWVSKQILEVCIQVYLSMKACI